MTQYLLSIYRPDGEAPPPESLEPSRAHARRAAIAHTGNAAEREFLLRNREALVEA